MHTRRFRALAVASIATAALSGVMVGGLANTAAAAPVAASHDKITTIGMDQLKPAIKVAQEHTKQVMQQRATQRKAMAADDCGTLYSGTGANAVRWAGADRYAVSVCVSTGTWFDSTDTDPEHQSAVADAVVLARGDAYADALAGGPLAAWVEGPLLLTKSTSLPSNVRAEIQRVLAPTGKVYLLGGTGSISPGVESTIASMGYKPVRIGGANRFEVAVNIAKAIPSTSTFFITNGMNFPDALAAGNAASSYTLGAKYDETGTYLPVVMLFTNDTTMPAVSGNFAVQRAQEHGDTWALMTAGGAGNTAAVRAFGADNIGYPYVGHSRYDTATLIDQDVFTDDQGLLINPYVGLVDGTNYPDALTGSVMLSGLTAPLMLTPPTKLDPSTATFLRNHAGDSTDVGYVHVFGGPASVSDSVMFAARTAFTPVA